MKKKTMTDAELMELCEDEGTYIMQWRMGLTKEQLESI